MTEERQAGYPALLIKNAIVLTPCRKLPGGGVFTKNGLVEKVFPDSEALERFESAITAGMGDIKVIDLGGDFLSPGFIDLHCHGGGGHDFMDGTAEAFAGAGRMHLSHGTTCLFPTTLASTREALQRTIGAFREVKGTKGLPEFPGLHLEGPYFAMTQRGAQDPKYIRNPDRAEYVDFLEYSEDIARWTLAPELPGALEMGKELVARGILPAIGHSDATYEKIAEAYENGFTLITHLYSGMSMVHRINAWRYAGVVESAYLIDGMAVEVIADGCHLPESLLRLICKIKRPDKICLVTDAMRAAGLPEGEYLLGGKMDGQKVLVRDGVAWTADGQSFASSVATAERLVKTMVTLAGVPVESAVAMMTSSPAMAMNIHGRKGSIVAGMDADLVAFDGTITVKAVIAGGRVETCSYR
jgi:N-acetylglucosamine-6-phosphate deacetylase